MRVDGPSARRFLGFLGLTALRAEGCGIASLTAPSALRALKIDGPTAQGFLSLTGLWPEGCGIAAFGDDEYEVSVTGFGFVSAVLHDGELEPPSSGRGVAP